jgi:hypothetical protein
MLAADVTSSDVKATEALSLDGELATELPQKLVRNPKCSDAHKSMPQRISAFLKLTIDRPTGAT